jgi:hypothetical protein
VTPAHGSEPPGTDSSNGNAPAPPTICAVLEGGVHPLGSCVRSAGSSSSSLGGGLKYCPIAPTARLVLVPGRHRTNLEHDCDAT